MTDHITAPVSEAELVSPAPQGTSPDHRVAEPPPL